jgi:hypothetical protein
MSKNWRLRNNSRRALRRLLGTDADLRKPPSAAEKRALSRHKGAISRLLSGDIKIIKTKSASSYASLKGSGATPLRGNRFMVAVDSEALGKRRDTRVCSPLWSQVASLEPLEDCSVKRILGHRERV